MPGFPRHVAVVLGKVGRSCNLPGYDTKEREGLRLELSSEGRYALRALLFLAWTGERVPAQRISAEAHVPRRLLARHSHARSLRYRTAGFTYHPTHDAWICPEDQLLTRTETDHERRLVRYRARPQICNHCPAKSDCTDSEHGREVVRAMDPWPHSEAGRFHRAVSLVIVLIAGLILAAETLRNHALPDLALLGGALAIVVLTLRYLHAAFRTTPANFPVFKAASSSPGTKGGQPTGYRKSKKVRR